jgi:hypothetical protein
MQACRRNGNPPFPRAAHAYSNYRNHRQGDGWNLRRGAKEVVRSAQAGAPQNVAMTKLRRRLKLTCLGVEAELTRIVRAYEKRKGRVDELIIGRDARGRAVVTIHQETNAIKLGEKPDEPEYGSGGLESDPGSVGCAAEVR